MTDFMFRFDDRESMFAVLSAAGFSINEDPRTLYHPDAVIDEVGVIHSQTGRQLMHDDGSEYPEVEVIPGWHVNIRILNGDSAPKIDGLAERVVPENPIRVWA